MSAEAITPLGALGAAVAARWWALAIRGVLAIIFALIAFFQPGATMLSLVLVFAAYAAADGVFALWAVYPAARGGGRWGMLLAEGAVNLITALIAVAWPGLTAEVFVVVLGAWAIITGALMLGAAFQLHDNDGQAWLVLGGLASFFYGLVLFIAPMTGALVLTWWIGAYALVFGVSLLLLAFKLRGLRKL